ncbi:MAG: sodium:proton antiporter [Candidatus Nanopelagicales bacterium]
MDLLEGIFATTILAIAVAGIARWRGWGIALPVLITGIIVGFLPFGPRAPADGGDAFLLVLAPLVFGEALSSSFVDFRRLRRPILALAIGLVIVSSLAVGAVAAQLVPGLPLAMAFALGAILSPTDAVAVASIAKRVSLPRRVVTILEGESLVNDGTGLTLLRVALAVAAAGALTAQEVLTVLAQSVLGGVAVGAVVGIVLALVIRRGSDDLLANALILIAPFPAYLGAEAIGGSGILAVVTAALIITNTMLTDRDFRGRRASVAVWKQITFVLTALAFMLVGLELPATIEELPAEELRLLPVLVICVLLTLLVARMGFVLMMALITRGDVRRRIGMREAIVLAWAGTRGPVSGLAAFSLPLGVGVEALVDQTQLLQATTFIVITMTLLLSPTLGVVARAVKLRGDDDTDSGSDLRAALAARGLAALDDALQEATLEHRPLSVEAESIVRSRLTMELRSAEEETGESPVINDGGTTVRDVWRLERIVLKAQHDELLVLRDSGWPDAVLRPAMHEIDLQRSALRARDPRNDA